MQLLRICSLVTALAALTGCGQAPEPAAGTPDQNPTTALLPKEIAVYTAALRYAIYDAAGGGNGIPFLQINGNDPPPEMLGKVFLPVSRSHWVVGRMPGGLEPAERVCDKVTGEPGSIISVKILEWLGPDRVKVQCSSMTGPLWGGGCDIFLKLKDGEWIYDGEDEKSHWVSEFKAGGEASFSQVGRLPGELQYSCAAISDPREERLASELRAEGTAKQAVAVRLLWRGHSRHNAEKVLSVVANASFRQTQIDLCREIEASIEPAAVLRELQLGDYRWATWLAGLKPHSDFVTPLLSGISQRPDCLPDTIVALGKSRDPRALEPLLTLLRGEDTVTAGFAAHALGDLRRHEAGTALLEALRSGDGWIKVNACSALGKLGTTRAIPELEHIAADERYTGALDIRGSARRALAAIRER
jgi:hypothetical protein